MSEGNNGTLIPVQNWAAYAEKGKVAGAIDLVDLSPIAAALKESYLAFEQVKQQVYELTGISDIIRGQSQASETATAQSIKGQYAGLRLRASQEDVARFAADLLRLKAQVICGQFSPETIMKIGGVDQLSPEDQQLVPQAMELLLGERVQNPDGKTPNPLRNMRIEIASDSLVQLDEQAEKEARVEFLTATAGFLSQTIQSLATIPPPVASIVVPGVMELLKFGVTGFKVGKSVEGTLDGMADQLKQLAKQPQAAPQVPPEQIQQIHEQAKQAAAQEVAQGNAQKEIALNKRAADLDIREMKFGAEQEISRIRSDADMQVKQIHEGLESSAKEQTEESVNQRDQQFAQSIETLTQSLTQLGEMLGQVMQAHQQMQGQLGAVDQKVEMASRRPKVKAIQRAPGKRILHMDDGTMEEVAVA
jgi:hypothetical protein